MLRAALGQLVAGVQAMHDDGKLHRDLKPSNVLVDATGRVVVLDFGLIHEIQTHLYAPDRGGAGTQGFMAPEQARGHPAVPASDWYSVGAILYQALTSEVPPPQKAAVTAARSRSRCPPALSDLFDLTLALLDPVPNKRPGYDAIANQLGLRNPNQSARQLQPIDGLVGRAAELARLRECLAQARAGQPTRVVIAGNSGIGKTALATAFLKEAVQHGAVALAGKCHDRDTIPYKALDTIVDELSRYLRFVSPREFGDLPAELPALLQVFPALGRVAQFRTAGSLDSPGELIRSKSVIKRCTRSRRFYAESQRPKHSYYSSTICIGVIWTAHGC